MDAHHRLLSDSPENALRRCPFAGGPNSDSDSDSDSSDLEAFRIESTGIFMLSLPDSFEEKDDSTPHLYQTAPEELPATGSDGQRSVAVDVLPCEEAVAEVADEYIDDGTAVDLGRDTDVGLYSEVQSTSETGEGEKSVEIIGVCRSRICDSEEEDFGFRESVVSLGESSSKKLKLSEDCDGKCELKGMDDGKVFNGDNGGIHCNYKEKSAEKEVKESVKNFELHQPIKLQENEMSNRHRSSSRLLPASISGVKNSNTSADPIVVTLLEILEVLKGGEEGEFDDEGLSKLSVLDVVQRRGTTFPRPEWWPPEV